VLNAAPKSRTETARGVGDCGWRTFLNPTADALQYAHAVRGREREKTLHYSRVHQQQRCYW
ncbi:MAG: hypothetical protein ACPIOQ_81355, partial [Promethearchaeia archaeon]